MVYDDLYHFSERPNIFRLKVDCGCWWQETPEDCIALYRGLMDSPVFGYIHDRLWVRQEHQLTFAPSPRVIAWNETDQKRIPAVWKNFVREVDRSTNGLWRLEARAFCLADATNETDMCLAYTNFFNALFENRGAFLGGILF